MHLQLLTILIMMLSIIMKMSSVRSLRSGMVTLMRILIFQMREIIIYSCAVAVLTNLIFLGYATSFENIVFRDRIYFSNHCDNMLLLQNTIQQERLNERAREERKIVLER